MEIDKVFDNTSVDGVADNLFSAVRNSVSEIKAMQQRKAAENVQLVIQALKKIESDLQDKYDGVTTVIEKRVSTIKDGRDGINGRDGRDGKDGRPGKDGMPGMRGKDGAPGQDGADGMDGVSVTDARIDFDGSLIIVLSSGREINVGEVVAPDLAERIKVITNGGGTSQGVLDTLASLQAQINALDGFLDYKGTWNASTNTPTLVSSTGTKGDYYVVSVAGSTNLNGETNWGVGDWVVFNNSTWQKIDGGSTGNLTTAVISSSLTLSYGTNNGVLYLNGSKVATSGSALTFDGTTLYVNDVAVGRGAASIVSNTAIGNNALDANTIGGSNTAVGQVALSTNTSGNDNVAVGSYALYLNNSGSSNTAIGSAALSENASGDSNSAFGQYALGLNTGSSNTAVGRSSGSLITTGSKNTILGRYDGNQGGLDIRTASNYIVLSDGDGNPRAYWNGANPTFPGSVTLSGGTANGVAYLNGSKVLTTGSALTFDGTNLATTGNVFLNNAQYYNAKTSGGTNIRMLGLNSGNTAYVGPIDAGPGDMILNASSSSANIQFYTAGTERMRIESATGGVGAVGIGYTSLTSVGNNGLAVLGNVGIGTSSPANKLVVSNAGAAGFEFDPANGIMQTYNRSSGAYTAAKVYALNFEVRTGSSPAAGTFFIDSSGNLGVGTTSPGAKLDIVGASSNQIRVGSAATEHYRIGRNASDGLLDFYGSQTGFQGYRFGGIDGTWATINASGNLGLGVTPSAWSSSVATQVGYGAALSSRAAGNTASDVTHGAYWNGTNWLYQHGSVGAARYQMTGANAGSTHAWFVSAGGTANTAITFTQAMTLDASGNLLVGRTSTFSDAKFIAEGASTSFISRLRNTSATTPSGLFVTYTAAAPNGTGELFLRCDDSAATRAEIRSNGGLANYSANDVNLSDRREKTNFAPAKSYLDAICAIPVQTFNYIDQSEDDPGLTLGVVAQDVQAVAPELVMESNWGSKDDPKMRLSIYQTDLQYALMKCIQEQQAIIEQLKADVAALKGA